MWINEGFCVFLERKAIKNLEGQESYLTNAYEGNVSLVGEIEDLGASSIVTQLTFNISGLNPEDASTTVAYEKGF